MSLTVTITRASYIIFYLASHNYKLDAALHSVQHLVLAQLVAGLAGDVGAAVVDAVLRLPLAGEMEAELIVWLLWESFSQVTTGTVLSGKGGGTLIIF